VPTALPPDRRFRVGIDIVEVSRVERLMSEHAGIETELFTDGELEYCRGKRRRYEHMAVRFAAKEAVLKAFGTGLVRRMRWTEVEVRRKPRGRPEVALTGEVAAWAKRRGVSELEISLSHTSQIAVAQALAVLEAG
jgi:holo-[acyl-carrier protein] synthase